MKARPRAIQKPTGGPDKARRAVSATGCKCNSDGGVRGPAGFTSWHSTGFFRARIFACGQAGVAAPATPCHTARRAAPRLTHATMTDDPPNPALLPAGLADALPPDAEREAALVEALMGVFAAHGYERVKPPLLEFEDSLLTGSGAAVAEQTFRLMDPVSQRMMGLRADTTPQVARIAATRLANAPRPLRLSYAGQVLRVRVTQLSPTRELLQTGVELIGAASAEADA